MTPELGQLALALALAVALVQAVVPLAGAANGNLVWMGLARPAAQGHHAERDGRDSLMPWFHAFSFFGSPE